MSTGRDSEIVHEEEPTEVKVSILVSISVSSLKILEYYSSHDECLKSLIVVCFFTF